MCLTVVCAGSLTSPKIYSHSTIAANLQGFVVDVSDQVFRNILGWDYDLHVYATYAAAFYHTRVGDCDFGAVFTNTPGRSQCFAAPAAGESWGTVTKGCPLYQSPATSTTTDSMNIASCCAIFLQPFFNSSSGLGIMETVSAPTVLLCSLMCRTGRTLSENAMHRSNRSTRWTCC